MQSFNLAGRMLGKYRLLEPLGRGGMAQVYKAYHAALDRYVAIKILRSDLVEQEEFLARFQREARAISSLRHPNIVQVFDFDVQENLHYMVMELLEGDTLRAHLNQARISQAPLPLPQILRITLDLLNALEYAHSRGIIHRDIKPANILLSRSGQAVLTDFGIAQILGNTQYTVSGALMGTLHYMAPEQGLKNACDQRSDLYSLGIVLYEMLTGYPPFDADTPLAILLKHLNDPLPLPAPGSLPLSLEALLRKALQKDPEERFQNAAEMAAAVQQVVEEGAQSLPTVAWLPPPEVAAPQGAILSGEARQNLNRILLEEETAADRVSSNSPAMTASQRLAPLASSTRANSPLTGAFHTIERFAPRRISTISAVFWGLALVTLVNFLLTLLGRWVNVNVFTQGWAFEVFLVAAVLSFVGWGAQTPWMLIPAIIVFGNAILLAYSVLTGGWRNWDFLWMLEPLLIGFAIYLPTKLNERPQAEIPIWGRFGGFGLGILSLLGALLTGLLALR